MKIIIVFTLFVVATIAEPPVNNRYLPPQQGLIGGSTSRTYLPPGTGGLGPHVQTNAVFRSRPFAPSQPISRRPSTQYGPPSLSSLYGAPRVAPSAQYGAPQVAPSAQYGAPQVAPSAQYGAPQVAPSAQYGAPQTAPSVQYGLPQSGLGHQSLSAPSQLYGTPGFGVSGGQNPRTIEQSRQYLPPGAGRGYSGDEGNNEPANYNFEYMVKDAPSGNDFGHRESRLGDRAEGLYYVVLPDGRKQTVQYEADQEGYKPRISYEDTGAAYKNSLGGYHGGYNQGGPY